MDYFSRPISSLLNFCINNKQCGLRVRPTRYAPPVCNPDLWPSDLETGVRVASKVGNLQSKFGHARPLGSGIIRYVRDGRTYRQTDKQTDGQTKATLIVLFPTVGGIIIIKKQIAWSALFFGRNLSSQSSSCFNNVRFWQATETARLTEQDETGVHIVACRSVSTSAWTATVSIGPSIDFTSRCILVKFTVKLMPMMVLSLFLRTDTWSFDMLWRGAIGSPIHREP